MSETELILDHTELTRLSVTCGRCGTILTFNVAGAAQPDPTDESDNCPGCSNKLTGLASLVNSFRLFHERIVQSNLSVTFRAGLPIK